MRGGGGGRLLKGGRMGRGVEGREHGGEVTLLMDSCCCTVISSGVIGNSAFFETL